MIIKGINCEVMKQIRLSNIKKKGFCVLAATAIISSTYSVMADEITTETTESATVVETTVATDSTEEVVSGYSSDILITSTTCDAYARQNSNGFQHNVLTRTAGTITEQAFDVCQIDFTNKKLYMKRIGAGSDRTYNLV